MVLTHKIICGDCIEVMKEMESDSVDLVVTDPPYGIGADTGVGGFGSSPQTARKYKDNWDTNRPSKKVFDEILRVGKNIIMFGGNYFSDLLPVSSHWIVWDKTREIKFNNPFSDCELLWTNIKNKNTVKKYVVIQQGFISREKERYHPTQKPVKLIEMIIMDYSHPNDLIFDPFLGSGTTMVAAERLGRNSIGIEISKEYCEIAYKRLLNEVRQAKLDRNLL